MRFGEVEVGDAVIEDVVGDLFTGGNLPLTASGGNASLLAAATDET